MSEAKIAPEDLPFSEAMAELEQIVKLLEAGQLGLEDSLERYERGVALLRACRARLAEAQQRVTMLVGELDEEEQESE
jgi:exodeoxyribonuclease VII small subunit